MICTFQSNDHSVFLKSMLEAIKDEFACVTEMESIQGKSKRVMMEGS